jgi:hypothetical protein
MSRRPAVQSATLLLSVLAVLAVVASPLASSISLAGHDGLTSHAAPGTEASSRPANVPPPTVTNAAHAPAVRPASTQTVGGRIFQTSETPNTGAEQESTLAVDNATGTIFSLSGASATLTAIDAYTGTVERLISFGNTTNPWFDTGLGYDNATNTLYVGGDTNALDSGLVTMLNASTFVSLGTVPFATSWIPSFVPREMLFDWQTNAMFIENYSTNDVMVLNTTNNSLATFTVLPCLGVTEDGYCPTDIPMILDNDTGVWLVIVPQASSEAPVLFDNPDLTFDTYAGYFLDSNPNSYLGPGTYDPYFGLVFFTNSTGDGTVFAYDANGTYDGNRTNAAFDVTQMTTDLATGWVVEAGYNESGPGAQLTGLDPLTGTVGWQAQSGSYWTSGSIYDFVLLEASNGTSYAATAGGEPGSNELLQLPTDALPVTVGPFPLLHYATQPDVDGAIQPVADASTGDVYWVNSGSYDLVAQSEATAATVWTWQFPADEYPESISVDAADSIVYVAAFGIFSDLDNIYALSTSSGAVELNDSLSYASSAIAAGDNHLLYVADSENDTVQVYTNGGSPGTLSWTASLALTAATSPCVLTASPVAEVVGVMACGLGDIVEVASVATHGVVGYYNATPVYWYTINFNATGALYIGSYDTHTVTILAAGTWAFVENLTVPFGVEWIAFLPQIDAVALSTDVYEAYNASTIDIVSVATGHSLGSFAPNAPIVALGADGPNGVVVAQLATGQTYIAALVALPGVATGLALTAGNTTLAASWTAAVGASGFPVTGYTVLTSSASTGPWTNVASGTATTASLTGLTDGTTYYVTIQATSGSGVSAFATPVSGVPAGVPYPPVALTAGAVTSSSLAFTWSAPSSNGGAAVSSYTLLYATSASGPWTPVSQGTAVSGTLAGLAAGTKYFVEVEAANTQGTGHTSAAVTATTSTAPTSSSGPPGGSDLILGVAVLAIVVVALLVVGLVMMRRRGGSSGSPPATGTSPPAGASGGTSGPTAPPPPPSS